MNAPMNVKRGLLCAAFALACDQLSKWLLLGLLQARDFAELAVTPFFNLVMVWNRGISFGMFAGHNQPLLLCLLSLVIVAILLRWLWQNPPLPVALAIGLVVGGALGNVIDRVRFGAVADFFDVHLMGYHWPAFNIADSAIFIGVVVLCWHSMFIPTRSHTKDTAS